MEKWLYNSEGEPIVFVINNEDVFSKSGRFTGRVEVRSNEVWDGSYKGEIVMGDRFLYDTSKGQGRRGMGGVPGTPGIPGIPGNIGAIALPAGYRDVKP